MVALGAVEWERYLIPGLQRLPNNISGDWATVKTRRNAADQTPLRMGLAACHVIPTQRLVDLTKTRTAGLPHNEEDKALQLWFVEAVFEVETHRERHVYRTLQGEAQTRNRKRRHEV